VSNVREVEAPKDVGTGYVDTAVRDCHRVVAVAGGLLKRVLCGLQLGCS
jgi:hypothetical protein